MSTIFRAETKTTILPRHDAPIRIQYFGPDDTRWDGTWCVAQLLEFHPDWDVRMNFRSYAYTSIPADLVQCGRYHTGVSTLMGQGYLEHPYLSVRELSLHEADLRELLDYCRAQPHPAAPLSIHPCPLPFPLWSRGDRITVIGKDSHEGTERIGQRATIAEIAPQVG